MKKHFFVSLASAVLMFFGCFPTSQPTTVSPQAKLLTAAKAENAVVKRTLYSPDYSKKYYCYDYSPTGYAIFDEDGTKLEFCPESASPYSDMQNGTYIYDGPTAYSVLPARKQVLSSHRASTQATAAEAIPVTKAPALRDDDYEYDYVEKYQLIQGLIDFQRNANDGKGDYNQDGTCGYLAAAILLYYAKYKVNYHFIDDYMIERHNGHRRFKYQFYHNLVTIGERLKKPHATTAPDICAVMEEYCKGRNINVGHFWMWLSTPININNCIRDSKPIILFGRFRKPYTNMEKINHAVVCYGLMYEFYGVGQYNRYFIVNFGWSSDTNHVYSKVYLADNILLNAVGSMYNMNY